MKISKLFHWLYASVMFLPLLIIPLYGIWTINHDHNEPISVEVKQNLAIDFNQLSDNYVTSGTFNGITYDITDSLVSFNGTCTSSFNWNICIDVPIISGHKYLISNYPVNMPISNVVVSSLQLYSSGVAYISLNENSSANFTTGYATANGNAVLRNRFEVGNTYDLVYYPQIFDLTQMYGVGHEPTGTQFKSYFPLDYYPYTISDKRLIKNVSVVTYSDTDIGSQFLYTLYNSTDKYLNFDEMLNLGAISDWINENVFNGNAPLVFYIVWHYLDYWLILSIFWLCFDVLIYVPNIAHRWLDKASLE